MNKKNLDKEYISNNAIIIAKYTFWFLANALWFGLFGCLIIFKNWDGLSLAIPIILHWSIEEIK